MSDMLDYLLTRRSVQAALLEGPAPTEEEIAQMLTIAARVPDHKKLEPWRFIRFNPEACAAFGELLADRLKAMEPEAPAARLEIERQRLLRAPLVIAVVSSPKFGAPVPEWEQVLSAGAVCMNLVHAAYASGFAGQWLTEWYSFDTTVLQKLGLAKGERIAGFVHIGRYSDATADRPRPKLDEITTFWEA